ncbi:hypothetical protein CDD83_534 [Cordyceps sp. RAO-2017]|nr:hypothetical protein CDD83_534 [Cordyceps sp. RAO-2017]
MQQPGWHGLACQYWQAGRCHSTCSCALIPPRLRPRCPGHPLDGGKTWDTWRVQLPSASWHRSTVSKNSSYAPLLLRRSSSPSAPHESEQIKGVIVQDSLTQPHVDPLGTMIDKSQCPAHTRTPWGRRDHRYDYRLRYLIMGVLLASFLAIVILGIVFTVERARKNDNDPEPVVDPVAEMLDQAAAAAFTSRSQGGGVSMRTGRRNKGA